MYLRLYCGIVCTNHYIRTHPLISGTMWQSNLTMYLRCCTAQCMHRSIMHSKCLFLHAHTAVMQNFLKNRFALEIKSVCGRTICSHVQKQTKDSLESQYTDLWIIHFASIATRFVSKKKNIVGDSGARIVLPVDYTVTTCFSFQRMPCFSMKE